MLCGAPSTGCHVAHTDVHESCLQQNEVDERKLLPYLQVVPQALDVRYCIVIGIVAEPVRS